MDCGHDYRDNVLDMLRKTKDFDSYFELKYSLFMYDHIKNDNTKEALKYGIYLKSKELSNEKIRNYDCASNLEVMRAYKKIYKWLDGFEIKPRENNPYQYEFVNKEGLHLTGIMMTDTNFFIEEALRYNTNICYNPKMNKTLHYLIYRIWGSQGLRNSGKIRYYFENMNIKEFILKNCNYLTREQADLLQSFFTIGNFIVAPVDFNLERNKDDLDLQGWSLTLQQIFQWFTINKDCEDIDNQPLEKLFSKSDNKDEKINDCVKWLKLFGTWQKFIDDNYLNELVDENDEPILYYEQFYDSSVEYYILYSLLKKVTLTINKRDLQIAQAIKCKYTKPKSSAKEDNEVTLKRDYIYEYINFFIYFLAEIFHHKIPYYFRYLVYVISDISHVDSIILYLGQRIPFAYGILLFLFYIIGKLVHINFFINKLPVQYFLNKYFLIILITSLIVGNLKDFGNRVEYDIDRIGSTKYKEKKLLLNFGVKGLSASILIQIILYIFEKYKYRSKLLFYLSGIIQAPSVILMLISIIALLIVFIFIIKEFTAYFENSLKVLLHVFLIALFLFLSVFIIDNIHSIITCIILGLIFMFIFYITSKFNKFDYFVVAKPWFSFLNVPTFRIICTIYFLFLYQLYSYRETVKK